MGSSAQNSSGVHWCRHRVRFNEVPEKVPKVPEKVWEALVQSQVRFNRLPEKIPEKVGAVGRLWGCGAGPRCFQHLASQHPLERFVKIKRCGCWGYHQSLFFTCFYLSNVCVYVYLYVYVYVHVHVYVYMYVHVCVCVHTWMHMHRFEMGALIGAFVGLKC